MIFIIISHRIFYCSAEICGSERQDVTVISEISSNQITNCLFQQFHLCMIPETNSISFN